jgi:periplasmic protein TonB
VVGRLTDGPWGRLVWSLPVGTIIAVMMVMAFLAVLAQAPLTPQPHNAVMVQIIELPSEPASGNAPRQPVPPGNVLKQEPPKPAEPTPADALPMVETAPPPPPKTMPRAEAVPPMPADALPMIATAPLPLPETMRRPDAVPSPPPTKPKPPRPQRTVRRAMAQQPRPPSQTAPGVSSPNRAPAAAAASRNPASGVTMGARALYKPMPDLPEELRHRQLSVVAVASFHVAADGSATVTLLQATANPLMNALMVTLRKWRFFPALENGHPVASIIEIRIPIVVK